MRASGAPFPQANGKLGGYCLGWRTGGDAEQAVEQSFKNDEASITVSLHCSALEHDGSFVQVTGHKLMSEAGFAQPWPGNKTNNLSLPLLRTLPCLADGTQFRLTSNQGGSDSDRAEAATATELGFLRRPCRPAVRALGTDWRRRQAAP
jgi:hypothetical protein